MPLVKEADGLRQWLVSIAAYSVAGLVSSTMVGWAIGSAGRLLPDLGILAITLTLLVASIVALREWGTLRVPLPEWRRQTSSLWGKVLPRPVAAMLWGFDIGLVFTTFLTFSGAWLLAAIALSSRDPLFAGALFGAHWLGRASTVWVVPWVIAHSRLGLFDFVELVARSRDQIRRVHALGALFASVVLVVLAVAGIPLSAH